VVNKVIGINGKPFDARDFVEENAALLSKMLNEVVDSIESGEFDPRSMALTIVSQSGEPSFWFSLTEDDMYVLHGATDAMRQTYWETVLKGYDDGE
jgi:hypothetical protein